MISQSLSSYKDNARMDQSTVIQLFENMKMLRDSEKYSKSMILNMDECWVSTENKQYHRMVFTLMKLIQSIIRQQMENMSL